MPAVTLSRGILAEVRGAAFPRDGLLWLDAAGFSRANPIGMHLNNSDVVARRKKEARPTAGRRRRQSLGHRTIRDTNYSDRSDRVAGPVMPPQQQLLVQWKDFVHEWAHQLRRSE
jgi:hypothetical protein